MIPQVFGFPWHDSLPTGTVMTPSATRRCYCCSKSRQGNEQDVLPILKPSPSVFARSVGAPAPESNTVQALLVDAQEVLLNLGIFDDRFGLKAQTPSKRQGQPSPAQHFTHKHSQPANHRPAVTHVLGG